MSFDSIFSFSFLDRKSLLNKYDPEGCVHPHACEQLASLIEEGFEVGFEKIEQKIERIIKRVELTTVPRHRREAIMGVSSLKERRKTLIAMQRQEDREREEEEAEELRIKEAEIEEMKRQVAIENGEIPPDQPKEDGCVIPEL